MTVATAHSRSETLEIHAICSFPKLKKEWRRLSNDQKRAVLAELDGDITEGWAALVIEEISTQSPLRTQKA